MWVLVQVWPKLVSDELLRPVFLVSLEGFSFGISGAGGLWELPATLGQGV